MASRAGGMDNRRGGGDRAGANPQRSGSPRRGPPALSSPGVSRLASGLMASNSNRALHLSPPLYKAYEETDCSLAEINPLVVSKTGDVSALDAKMNFDDNALYRHPDIQALRDLDEDDPLEVEASQFALNYIQTRRRSRLHGQRRGPWRWRRWTLSNTRDHRRPIFSTWAGGTNVARVKNAMRILTSDSDVKAVPHQHFRRHRALRPRGRGRCRGPQRY